jgi:hypothetical protein
MKACNDLEFLSNYWIEAKKIGQKIQKELPKTIGTQATSKSQTGLLCFVKYSDITNSWSVNDLLAKVYGESPTLKILADKIDYMINMGRGNDVPVMIEKICTGRIKKLSQINNTLNNDYLGHGHFRWNYKAHTLNQKEIKHLKEYFKL